MGRVKTDLRPCDRCRESFEPTRTGQTMCRTCRRRLSLERHAIKRLKDLTAIEAALEAALGIVQRERDRWRNVAAGSPRKRGQWRRSRSG